MSLIAAVQSRFGEAEKHFLKGVALELENYQAHAYLGSTYLRLNPNLAEAHFELGLIALAEGKTEQGVAALQKAVDLEPGLATAHYRLGLAYRRAGNETRAQEELSRFRALKEEAHQRDRVLQSLAAIATNEPHSGEQP